MNKKKAFTFGEFMITLSILGVVAALIIPSLFARINERKWVTGCRKAYTTLSQVTDAAILDRGPLKNWPDSEDDSEKVYRYFAQHLNITKECLNTAGCWTKNVEGLNGSSIMNFSDLGYGTPAISFKTADGMNVTFYIQTGVSTWQGVDKDYSKNNSMYIFFVDVNGDQTPNTVGKDIFNFIVTNQGLLPAGDRTLEDNGCNKNTDGMNCAARVLNEGNMSYLH